ncbi:hypothetical protein [Candidatus Nanohalobium constans]|uniref:Uncharacterized protein n=1 Tax=Candidatus Nanohalobium constans TaxID=2565781 RepID=A0A5Q0UHK1_9ARCH|nr:hypothetical protein [Candidatus Nanohalobium constans]QGA80831.1 hypothetical protein LC1Nh_0949 [Candidatus Nanohalobium constans]
MKKTKGFVSLALSIYVLVFILLMATHYLQNQSVSAELYATTDFDKEQFETNLATAALLNETTKQYIIEEKEDKISHILAEMSTIDFRFQIKSNNGMNIGRITDTAGSTTVTIGSPSEEPLEVTMTQGEKANE